MRPSFTKYRDVDVLTKKSLDERTLELMNCEDEKKKPKLRVDIGNI